MKLKIKNNTLELIGDYVIINYGSKYIHIDDIKYDCIDFPYSKHLINKLKNKHESNQEPNWEELCDKVIIFWRS